MDAAGVTTETRLREAERDIEDLREEVDEICKRKTPWLTIIAIAASVGLPVIAGTLSAMVQVNLNADRISRNRETIEQIRTDYKELAARVYQLERGKSESSNKARYAGKP